MRSNQLRRSLGHWIVVFSTGLFFVPFLLLCIYATPAADDFCKASLSYYGQPQHNALEITWRYYLGWSSRWASVLVESLVMNNPFLLRLYPVWLLTVAGGTIVALRYFFETLLDLGRRAAWLVSIVFFATWLSSVKAPGENVLWLTGVLEYQLSLILLMAIAAILLGRRSPTRASLIIVVVCAVLVPAQHEMAGVLLVAFLGVGVGFRWWLSQPIRNWSYALAGSAISLALVVIAPGPRARSVAEGLQLWNIGRVPTYLIATARDGHEWLLNPVVLLSSLWILLYVQSLRSGDRDPKTRTFAFIACSLGMVAVLGEELLTATASGSRMPDRAVGWLQFCFLLPLVLAGALCAPRVGDAATSRSARTTVAALLAVALLSTANFRRATGDLLRIRPWRAYVADIMDTRVSAISTEAPPQPQLFFPIGLRNESDFWVNRCAANYLGLSDLFVKTDDSQKTD
jgi:Family of unknown function (DUF6056)